MAHRKLLVLALVAALAAGCATGESYVRQGYDFSGIDKVVVVEVGQDGTRYYLDQDHRGFVL